MPGVRWTRGFSPDSMRIGTPRCAAIGIGGDDAYAQRSVDSRRPIVFLAPLALEARAARKALVGEDGSNDHLRVYTIGMGGAALDSLLRAVDLRAAGRVWLVGLAGALDADLRVGDLVLDPPEGVSPPSTEAARKSGITIRLGRIHTAGAIVTTADEKRRLHKTTGALAVDMEQTIVRAALAQLGVAVWGLRAISDDAETSLDPCLPRLIDVTGRPRPVAIAAQLVRRPALVRSLVRLGRASNRACRELAEGIRLLNEMGEPTSPTGPGK